MKRLLALLGCLAFLLAARAHAVTANFSLSSPATTSAGIYNATPAHMLDIHSVMIENPDLQVITEDGGERRKANTIKASDTLRMKQQRSFFCHAARSRRNLPTAARPPP